MPTQSWKNLDPETGVHGEVDEKDWPLIRENWPAYDKKMMPTNTMGAVAEMFRQWPGSVRSDHPARSICAWGKNAAYLTQNHDLSDIFGESSPLAKLYALNGKVLLLGTGYNKNTSMHLADVRAEYAGKHMCIEHSAIWENGGNGCGRPPCSWMARILSRMQPAWPASSSALRCLSIASSENGMG